MALDLCDKGVGCGGTGDESVCRLSGLRSGPPGAVETDRGPRR